MRTILPLIALATLAAPAVAEAPLAEEVVTVRIDTADLDVTTSAGRAELEARINAKVRSACTISRSSRYAHGRRVLDETCIANARAEALAQVARIASGNQNGGRQVSAN